MTNVTREIKIEQPNYKLKYTDIAYIYRHALIDSVIADGHMMLYLSLPMVDTRDAEFDLYSIAVTDWYTEPSELEYSIFSKVRFTVPSYCYIVSKIKVFYDVIC